MTPRCTVRICLVCRMQENDTLLIHITSRSATAAVGGAAVSPEVWIKALYKHQRSIDTFRDWNGFYVGQRVADRGGSRGTVTEIPDEGSKEENFDPCGIVVVFDGKDGECICEAKHLRRLRETRKRSSLKAGAK